MERNLDVMGKGLRIGCQEWFKESEEVSASLSLVVIGSLGKSSNRSWLGLSLTVDERIEGTTET